MPTARPGREAELRIRLAPALPDAIPPLVPLDARPGLIVLPSSLSRHDRLAAAVRASLRAEGIQSHLVTPPSVLAGLPGSSRWRAVQVPLPGVLSVRVAVPERLVSAPARWVAIDLDAVAGRGPYALDLLARYLHPRDRLRLLAARPRDLPIAALNLVLPVERYLLARSFPGFRLAATTTDPIVAELFALALADESLPAGSAVQGAWEEPLVQRATELDLGVQVPAQIRIEVDGLDLPGGWEAIQRLTSRIGVRFS